jgi:hypothetical protein
VVDGQLKASLTPKSNSVSLSGPFALTAEGKEVGLLNPSPGRAFYDQLPSGEAPLIGIPENN